MTTASAPESAYFDAFGALFGSAIVERPGQHFDSYFVRAMSAPALVEAIDAIAAKVAKRVPGLVVTTYTDAYVRPEGEDLLWCEAHRVFCSERGVCGAVGEMANEFATACYKAPAAAVTVEVRVEGLPMWDGEFSVGGVLTRDENGAVVCTSVGSRFDDATFAIRHRDLMGQCAHCNKNRARNTTILLVSDETGEIRPVGKSCLGEYTGGALRTETLAALTGLRERFATEVGGILRTEDSSAPTAHIVALAMRYIALDGFVRVNDGGRFAPTAHSVRAALGHVDGPRPRVMSADLTDADLAAARDAIELVLTEQTDNDYMLNLQEVAALDWAQFTGRRNRVGLLASLPTAAARIVEARAREAAKAAQPERMSVFIGEMKQRREFNGTIVVARNIENDFGTSTLLEIDTAEGIVKIFGRVTLPAPFEYAETGSLVGKDIRVTGTISKHEEFRGLRRTQIARVKVAQIIG